MLSNFVLSNIRTYVPLAVGALLAWLASSLHLVIDPSSQAGLVVLATGALSGAYYGLVHLFEQRWPKLGVLLGAAKLPFYAAQDASGAYNVTALPPVPAPPAA